MLHLFHNIEMYQDRKVNKRNFTEFRQCLNRAFSGEKTLVQLLELKLILHILHMDL